VDGTAADPGDGKRGLVGAVSTARIAVVGAGPAGLAATLALAEGNRDVVLIAPKMEHTDWRTSALLTGSVAFLDKLGVWEKISPHASPLRRMRIVDGTHRLIRAPEVTFASHEVGLDAFGYNVRNSDLVAALEDAVAERRIHRMETMATAAQARDGALALTCADGSALRAQLVAAADGRHSAMRTAAGIGVTEWTYDQAALVVNLRHTRPHDDTSTEFHTEHGPFTLVPLGFNQSSLVWVGRPQDHQRRMALADDALAAEIEERAQSILGAMTLASPRQLFPLSGMTARRFAANRVALIGEAGHVVPPIGAQGLNLGLRDVAELTETIREAADPGDDALLDRYDRARQFDVVSRTSAIDALNRTVLTGFLPAQLLRGLGLFLLDRVPPLKRAAMRQGLGASTSASAQ
jgi:2-octaprenyl-6-methoxyphenol hydroxylase